MNHPPSLQRFRIEPSGSGHQRCVDIDTTDDEILPRLRKPWVALGERLRKTALSIPSNIAEGRRRESERELGRVLSIAAGSASELDYQR
ncbi:MAG: four helix bundle protein [Polyangiaceae bacterium]